ncbi:MAG: type II toxin-antitoxin system RelE/ParE family toxin [Verrucomicrobia bacterium]|nr:type II toxin-antitoxin system RelE/ParE family toxin [Verrucomicrobiota bacterium]
MTPRLHPEAQAELAAAALYYDGECPGLGEEFLDAGESSLSAIAFDPARHRQFDEQHRKINLHRFPYALIYKATPQAVVVKTVMHLHRQPGYWKRRQ